MTIIEGLFFDGGKICRWRFITIRNLQGRRHGSFGTQRAHSAGLQHLCQRIGHEQQGHGQWVQGLQADHTLGIALPAKFGYELTPGRLIDRPIGLVRQGFAALVE